MENDVGVIQYIHLLGFQRPTTAAAQVAVSLGLFIYIAYRDRVDDDSIRASTRWFNQHVGAESWIWGVLSLSDSTELSSATKSHEASDHPSGRSVGEMAWRLLSYKGHMRDALAARGDERRRSLRKAPVSGQARDDPEMSEWGNPAHIVCHSEKRANAGN